MIYDLEKVKMKYNVHFEDEKVWTNCTLDSNSDRINYILKIFPQDINSILDVGCGNGIITNELAKHYRVIGIDYSFQALKFVQSNKIRASSNYLPIKDSSFDAVFSSEMIEHLPESILEQTVSEFKRVTKKYLILTTPNQENLTKRYVKCKKCGYVFHVDHHVNSFNKEILIKLIGDDFNFIQVEYFGWLDKEYNKFLLKIKQNLGKVWWPMERELTVCPKCGNTEFEKEQNNLISKICNGLNRFISRNKSKPYWMLIVFKKIRKDDV